MEAGGDPRHYLLKRCFLVELEQHAAGPKVYCRAKNRHYVPAVPTLQRIQDFFEVNLGPHADGIIAAQGLARPTRQQNWLLPAVAAGFDVYAGAWPGRLICGSGRTCHGRERCRRRRRARSPPDAA
jgi:hypothetical protein